MRIGQVTIIGGSGFVGRHIARLLATRGVRLVIPTRNRERAKPGLIVLPTADVVTADVHAPGQLEMLVRGSDAVINLVGVLHERRRGEFERVHVELPARIVEACRKAGVPRLLHMSALGADAQGPSAYLRSKGKGEAAVLQAAAGALEVTLFRPSVIFGAGDSFLSLFARVQEVLPVVLLAAPQARFQPVWVEDVARAYAEAAGDRRTFGQVYELCGPKVYSLRELVELAGRASGHPRPIVGLGRSASYLQAALMEWLPMKLLTRDNLRSMAVDNVCGCGWPEVFAMPPTPLEAVAPGYLAPSVQRHYDGFRARAGR
jgi:NADH dehydrogenase